MCVLAHACAHKVCVCVGACVHVCVCVVCLYMCVLCACLCVIPYTLLLISYRVKESHGWELVFTATYTAKTNGLNQLIWVVLPKEQDS